MAVPIWAGKYIGLPFSPRGRGRDGLDCWGLVRLVMAEQFGVVLPSYDRDYRGATDIAAIPGVVARESACWLAVTPGDERLGDVIVMRIRGYPLHVGLALGDGLMLHIERGIDSAIERYRSTLWKDRIHGFYRHPG